MVKKTLEFRAKATPSKQYYTHLLSFQTLFSSAEDSKGTGDGGEQ